MECVGMLTIAKYRKCDASAIYIITDVIDKDGWHLGWNGDRIRTVVGQVIKIVAENA